MPNSCVAYGCTNRATPEVRQRGISFHRLPIHDPFRAKWIEAIRRQNWNPDPLKDHYVVCSEHFEQSDFRDVSSNRKCLKEEAIPTVFPAFPSYLQPQTKAQRCLPKRSGLAEESQSSYMQPQKRARCYLPQMPGLAEESRSSDQSAAEEELCSFDENLEVLDTSEIETVTLKDTEDTCPPQGSTHKSQQTPGMNKN